MKKGMAILLASLIMLSLAACGMNNTESYASEAPAQTEAQENASTTESTAPDTVDSTESTDNILVTYFSLAGEQYGVGVIEEGNTCIIAHIIAEQTGADLFEIQPVTPYPEKQSELLTVAQQEQSENTRPEIAGTVDNMENYDTVFIGYPIWWGDMPMIVYNFLESYDFSGKTVIPFCTHGGSGLARTESTIADLTGAIMPDGFAISGETAQNDRDRAQSQVTDWLNKIDDTN